MAFSVDTALEIGKAAEHLVCADVILSGHRCFLSDQGLPYDLVADVDSRLLRIQVKSTCFAKNVNSRGRNERIAYSWSVRRRGRKGQSRLTDDQCDIVALVALDIREIAYFPIEFTSETMQLSPPGVAPKTKRTSKGMYNDISKYPLAAAISGSADQYIQRRLQITHCPAGHEYTPENSRVSSNGSLVCIECARVDSRDRARAKRLAIKEAANDN